MVKLVDKQPSWVCPISVKELKDEGFVRIVSFFVFHSPCPGLSAMGRTLNEYGWSTPWRKPYYLNKQLKQASTNYQLLFSASKYEVMEETLDKADLNMSFPTEYNVERVAIFDNKENQFLSVFYHIRNSIAHGRMHIIHNGNECIFVFEDVKPSNSEQVKVSARMILRKETLLKWIDIIEQGEKEYRRTDTEK